MGDVKYKLLLVEDDKLDQKAFERFVKAEELPYDCTTAGSVGEAKQVLKDSSFDAVISDYSLGDGSALDVLAMVKDAPVILVTGAGDEEVAVQVWQAGAYDYLTKDVDRNYLKALPITVENAIRHKRTEDHLRLLSGAVRSTDDSVYITDLDDKIVFVNRAFCRTYGYKEEEIVGREGSILWAGNEATQGTRSVFQSRAIGSSWEVGFYHKRQDGSIFPVSLSRSIIKDTKGRDMAIVGVGRDITDRILAEDELRGANAKLEKQNRLLNEMAIAVGKSLDTMLSQNRTEEARGLIHDFHDLLSVSGGRARLERQEFPLDTAISNVSQTLASRAGERQLNIDVSGVDPQWMVVGDYVRIKQVLRSLLVCAIDGSRDGGRIEVQVRPAGPDFVVEIQGDDLAGGPDGLGEVLNAFEHVQAAKSEQSSALNLGPAIAKELIEMHGGRIWVKTTQENHGAVCFTLPQGTAVQKCCV